MAVIQISYNSEVQQVLEQTKLQCRALIEAAALQEEHRPRQTEELAHQRHPSSSAIFVSEQMKCKTDRFIKSE